MPIIITMERIDLIYFFIYVLNIYSIIVYKVIVNIDIRLKLRSCLLYLDCVTVWRIASATILYI
jgi:hypothetical protein